MNKIATFVGPNFCLFVFFYLFLIIRMRSGNYIIDGNNTNNSEKESEGMSKNPNVFFQLN